MGKARGRGRNRKLSLDPLLSRGLEEGSMRALGSQGSVEGGSAQYGKLSPRVWSQREK